MKSIALIMSVIFSVIGCGVQPKTATDPQSNPASVVEEPKQDLIPMVMIDGELYLDTGEESDITRRCGVMDGEITSTVENNERPTVDNQSNFGEGYEYQGVGANSIDVFMNEKWIRFEKENAYNWGVELSATNVKPTGLTLVCNQSGGEQLGELQTGSPFWLEVKKDNTWVEIQMLQSEFDMAWTMEAWIISANNVTQWDVDWNGLYGELPTGSYRIIKEIMDFVETGNYETNKYYAYFEILE